MAMRFDCKNFDSRTYSTGETVRKCRLDLAPNAPWDCPQDCLAFEKRTVDVGWDYGSLAAPIITPADTIDHADPDASAKILDEAEDIVNAISPELFAEFKAMDEANKKGKKKKKRKKK